jgi:YVTN family beta-propeller protein
MHGRPSLRPRSGRSSTPALVVVLLVAIWGTPQLALGAHSGSPRVVVAHGGPTASAAFLPRGGTGGSYESPHVGIPFRPDQPIPEPPSTETLDLANDTLSLGLVYPVNGGGPTAIAYVASLNELLVADTSGGLEVVNASTMALLGWIPDPPGSSSVVYDPIDQEAFVTDDRGGQVSIFGEFTLGGGALLLGTVAVGAEPDSLAFDAAKDAVFVGNSGSGNVSVLSGATHSLVATVALGSAQLGPAPTGLAYDAAAGAVFASEPAYCACMEPTPGVAVKVNDTTNQIVENYTVGVLPLSLALDAASQDLFVANEGTANVTVLNVTSGTAVTSLPLAGTPGPLGFDPADQDLLLSEGNGVEFLPFPNGSVNATVQLHDPPGGLLVTPNGSQVIVTTPLNDNLTVIEPSGPRLGTSIVLGSAPNDLAYDPITGSLWVADADREGLETVDDSSNQVTASLATGEFGSGVAFVPTRNEMFVSSGFFGDNSVTVYNATTRQNLSQIPVGLTPRGLAYDPAEGEVFVANEGSDNVSVINISRDRVVTNVTVGANPIAAAYVAGADEVFVANNGSDTVSVIDSATDSVVATVGVGEGPDAVAFDSGTDQVLVANFASDDVTEINASTNQITTTLGVGSGPDALAYDAAAREMLIATYVSDDVNVVADGADFATSTLLVGDQPDAIAVDPEYGSIYVANAGDGTLTIFLGSYAVTFVPNGLPEGQLWTVHLNGVWEASTDLITFQEPNGTFEYEVGAVSGYTTTPFGNVTVDGIPQEVEVFFSPFEYPVTFRESGLEASTPWTVVVGDLAYNALQEDLTIFAGNGTYGYTAEAAGYVATPEQGEFIVDGAGIDVNVVFVAGDTVVFSETGLSVDTLWSVDLAGQTTSSSSPSIAFVVVGGTYPFTISSSSSLAPSPSAGSVTVSSGTTRVSVTFGEPSAPVPPESFAPWVWPAIIGVVVVAGAVVLGSAAVDLRKPRGPR